MPRALGWSLIQLDGLLGWFLQKKKEGVGIWVPRQTTGICVRRVMVTRAHGGELSICVLRQEASEEIQCDSLRILASRTVKKKKNPAVKATSLIFCCDSPSNIVVPFPGEAHSPIGPCFQCELMR